MPPRLKSSEILAARLERPALIADAPTPDLDRLAALLPDAPILRLSALSGEGDEANLDPGDEPDIFCLLPTSGSTGTVKLVMLDRRAILNRYFSQNYSVASLNRHTMNVFAFEGISGLGALFLRYASLTQLHPRTLTTRPLAIFEAIERFAITHRSHDQFDGGASGRRCGERRAQFRSRFRSK